MICRDRGQFFNDGNDAYLFLNEEKILIHTDIGNHDLMRLLHRYGINRSENLYRFISASIHVEAFDKGKVTEIYRLSHYNTETFTLYLFNNKNEIYRISPEKMDLIPNGSDGVLFVKAGNAEPFELVSVKEGEFILDRLVISGINFESDELSPDNKKILFVLWLLALFFQSIFPTKPIIALLGGHGAGKTSIARIILWIILGMTADVTSLRKPDDFDTAVGNSPLVVFDNVDEEKEWLNDKLAVAATGGAIRKRKLYTDNEEVAIPIKSFLGITSRDPHFKREDVSERLLIMRLGRRTRFEAESKLRDQITRNRNELLSEIMSYLQDITKALRDFKDTDTTGSFRMADFYDFCLKIAMQCDIEDELKAIFKKLTQEQSHLSLEDDPIFQVLKVWVCEKPDLEVDAAKLLNELTRCAERKKMEFNNMVPSTIGKWIMQHKPNLEMFFVMSERTGRARQKFYRFKLLEECREQ